MRRFLHLKMQLNGSRTDLEDRLRRAHVYSSLSVFIDTCSMNVCVSITPSMWEQSLPWKRLWYRVFPRNSHYHTLLFCWETHSISLRRTRCAFGTKNIFFYAFLFFSFQFAPLVSFCTWQWMLVGSWNFLRRLINRARRVARGIDTSVAGCIPIIKYSNS